jgi:molybdate transport system substrate-binding protein
MRFGAIALAILAMTGPAMSETIQLTAAGSLKLALTEVAKAYETASGNKVEAKWGASTDAP